MKIDLTKKQAPIPFRRGVSLNSLAYKASPKFTPRQKVLSTFGTPKEIEEKTEKFDIKKVGADVLSLPQRMAQKTFIDRPVERFKEFKAATIAREHARIKVNFLRGQRQDFDPVSPEGIQLETDIKQSKHELDLAKQRKTSAVVSGNISDAFTGVFPYITLGFDQLPDKAHELLAKPARMITDVVYDGVDLLPEGEMKNILIGIRPGIDTAITVAIFHSVGKATDVGIGKYAEAKSVKTINEFNANVKNYNKMSPEAQFKFNEHVSNNYKTGTLNIDKGVGKLKLINRISKFNKDVRNDPVIQSGTLGKLPGEAGKPTSLVSIGTDVAAFPSMANASIKFGGGIIPTFPSRGFGRFLRRDGEIPTSGEAFEQIIEGEVSIEPGIELDRTIQKEAQEMADNDVPRQEIEDFVLSEAEKKMTPTSVKELEAAFNEAENLDTVKGDFGIEKGDLDESLARAKEDLPKSKEEARERGIVDFPEDLPETIAKKPARKAEDVLAEQETFTELTKFITENTGKKVTPKFLETQFERMKSEKKVTDLNDFITKAEKGIEQQKESAKSKLLEEARKDFVRFDEDVDSQIKGIALNPVQFVKDAGLKAKNKKTALNLILEKDVVPFESLIEDMVRTVEELGVGEEVDIFDAIQEEVGMQLDILEGKTPRISAKAPVKPIRKNMTPEEKALITAENKLIRADFKIEQQQKLIETLRERPTEIQAIKKSAIEFSKGFRRGSTKTKQDLKLIKKQIAAYTRKHIPRLEFRKSEVNALVSQIAKVETPKQVDEAMQKVLEIENKMHKRIFMKQFDRLLTRTKAKKVSGLIRGKLTPETQTLMEKIRKYKDLTLEEVEAQREANTALLLEDPDNVDIILDNEALGFGGIAEMEPISMLERVDQLKNVISGARAERTERIEGRKRRGKAVSIPTINTISGKGFRTKTKQVGKADELAGQFLESFISMSDYLSRYDKGSMPGKSSLSETAFLAQDAAIQTGALQLQLGQELTDIAKDVFGDKLTVKQLKAKFKEYKKVETVASGRNQDGAEIIVNMSGFDTASFLMNWKQLPTREIMLQTEIITKAGKRYKITEELADQIIASVPKELESFLEQAKVKVLKPLRDMQAPLIEERTGIQFPDNPDYFPRASERNVVQSAEDLLRQNLAVSSGIPSSAKGRSKFVKAVQLTNPITQVYTQLDEVTHYVGHYDFTTLFSSLFANEAWTGAIRDNFSPVILETYRQHFTDVSIGRVAESKAGAQRKIEQGIDFMMDRIVVAQLGAKINILLTQLTSIPASIAGSNPIEWAKDTAAFFVKPKANALELWNGSQWLQQRVKSGKFEQDIDNISSSDAARSLLKKESIAQALMVTIKVGDVSAVAISGWHTYKKARRNGMSKERAIKEFERVASGSQQESAMYSRNALQKIKLLRPVRTYKTTVFQYTQQSLKYMRALVYGRGEYVYSPEYVKAQEEALARTPLTQKFVSDKELVDIEAFSKEEPKQKSKAARAKNKVRFATAFLLFWSGLNMMYTLVKDGFRFKEENQLRAAVLGNIGAILIAGDLVSAAWGSLFLNEHFGSNSPLISSLESGKNFLVSTIKNLKKLGVGEEFSASDKKKIVKDTASTLGVAFKFPLSGLAQFGVGAIDLAQGRTDNPLRLIMSEYAVGSPKQAFYDEIEKHGNTPKAIEMFKQLQKDGDYSKKTKFSTIYKARNKAGKAAKATIKSGNTGNRSKFQSLPEEQQIKLIQDLHKQGVPKEMIQKQLLG